MAGQRNVERRNIILKNTFKFLRKEGMDNLSLQMIADESNISKSLLQAYYPHKSNLIVEIATAYINTIIEYLSSEKYSDMSEFVKFKLLIYIVLHLAREDRSFNNVLDGFWDYNNLVEGSWGPIAADWLYTDDDLTNLTDIQNGVYFVIAGGGDLYLRRAILELNAEEISDIMVKTFMVTFHDLPIDKVNCSLAEGKEAIKEIEIAKVFEMVNTMFD